MKRDTSVKSSLISTSTSTLGSTADLSNFDVRASEEAERKANQDAEEKKKKAEEEDRKKKAEEEDRKKNTNKQPEDKLEDMVVEVTDNKQSNGDVEVINNTVLGI